MSVTPRDYLLEEIRSIESSMKEINNQVNTLDKTLTAYKTSFEHHIQVDEDMYTELKRMNDILAQNTESLKVHIRRTELLENITIKLGNRLTELEIKDIESKAINKWISDRSVLVGKIIAGLVALGSLAAMLPEFLKWLTR